MAKTLIALYDDFDTANDMVNELATAGVPREDISLITSYTSREYSAYLADLDEGTFTPLDDDVPAAEGATIGAVEGGLIGLGLALIPGVGPILAAGPLVAAVTGGILGAAAGAATGGIVAALVDLDLPETEAGAYAEGVRRGGALVVVDVPNDEMADDAEVIMEEYDPVDMEERQQIWHASGWTGFDRSAPPFTAEQIARERAAWAPSNSATDDMDDTLEVSLDDTRESVTSGTGGLTGYNMDAHTEPDGGVPSRYDPGYTYGTPAEPGADQGDETGSAAYSDDFNLYEKDLRTHYDLHYAGTGVSYDRYLAAYRYGYRLAHDDRYRDHLWRDIEPDVRRQWEAEHPGSWYTFADAIQYMWGAHHTVRS